MKRKLILLSTVGLAITLSACTGQTTATSSSPSSSASALDDYKSSVGMPTGQSEAAPTTSEAAPSSSGPQTATFGNSFTYKDGVTVGVVRPLPFFPSETAAGFTPGQKALVFHITVTNGGTGTYDPSTFQAVAQADGAQGESVFDSAKGIGGSPSALVLPGKSISWDEVFSFPSTNEVALQVTPGYEYQTNVFTG